MTSLSSKVVIIGAGIVGTNIADELTSRGWSDITVVEQGPLYMPGGSTSHAPGLVFQTNSSRTMTRLATYTMQKLLSLEKDGQTCFNQVGGLEIATTQARLQELQRRHGWASAAGVESHLIERDTCVKLYPLLNRDMVLGGLFIPTDGLALAARAVQLLVERTQRAGVLYKASTRVTGIQRSQGRVTAVTTDKGDILADIIISCAGFWGVEVGKMVDLVVPLLPMAHQYVKTSAIECLGKPPPNSARLPILRHQDQDLYFREHGDHYGIGYYGHRPIAVDAASLPISQQVNHHHMPSRLDFTPEDFNEAWRESQSLLPVLHDTKIADGFNGIFSFTPDGGPLVGKHPSLEGFYVAEAVWVTHSAGVARAMAEVLTYGNSSIDLRECDLQRFDHLVVNEPYIEETSKQNFVEVYDIIHPLDQRTFLRNLAVSPFFDRQMDLGAYFIESGGWERPYYYTSNEVLAGKLPVKPIIRDAWSAKHYSTAVAVEAYWTMTKVAMHDLTPLRRIEISGEGALDLVQHVATINVSGPSIARYGLMLDDHGGIKSEITVHKYDDLHLMVECNGNADLVYFDRQSRSYPGVKIRDITLETCCIGLWGPLAGPLLSRFIPVNTIHGQISHAEIAGIPITTARLSLVGEMGWQIYSTATDGQKLWDTLYRAGQSFSVIAAGRAAFNSLRIQQGHRFWGQDMTTEHSPAEAGVTSRVDAVKTDYVGFGARRKIKQRSVLLTIDDRQSMVMGKEPVYHQGRVIGYVTSAAFGYGLGMPIALAWLREDAWHVEIEYFGRRISATVVRDSTDKVAKREVKL